MDVDKEFFSNITSRERAIFEGAIMEESLELQPAIEKVEAKINRQKLEEVMTGFDYTCVNGDMLDIKIYSKVDDVLAVIRIKFIEELNYPLMFVEDIIE